MDFLKVVVLQAGAHAILGAKTVPEMCIFYSLAELAILPLHLLTLHEIDSSFIYPHLIGQCPLHFLLFPGTLFAICPVASCDAGESFQNLLIFFHDLFMLDLLPNVLVIGLPLQELTDAMIALGAGMIHKSPNFADIFLVI